MRIKLNGLVFVLVLLCVLRSFADESKSTSAAEVKEPCKVGRFISSKCLSNFGRCSEIPQTTLKDLCYLKQSKCEQISTAASKWRCEARKYPRKYVCDKLNLDTIEKNLCDVYSSKKEVAQKALEFLISNEIGTKKLIEEYDKFRLSPAEANLEGFRKVCESSKYLEFFTKDFAASSSSSTTLSRVCGNLITHMLPGVSEMLGNCLYKRSSDSLCTWIAASDVGSWIGSNDYLRDLCNGGNINACNSYVFTAKDETTILKNTCEKHNIIQACFELLSRTGVSEKEKVSFNIIFKSGLRGNPAALDWISNHLYSKFVQQELETNRKEIYDRCKLDFKYCVVYAGYLRSHYRSGEWPEFSKYQALQDQLKIEINKCKELEDCSSLEIFSNNIPSVKQEITNICMSGNISACEVANERGQIDENPPLLYSCKLNENGKKSSQEIVSFYEKPESKFKIEIDTISTNFMLTGKIKLGACAGGDLYIVQIDEGSLCGKPGGLPDQIFADDTEYENTEKVEFENCKNIKYAVKTDDKLVFLGKFQEVYFDKTFQEKVLSQMKLKVAFDRETNFQKVFLQDEKVKIGDNDVYVNFPEYEFAALNDFSKASMKNFEKFKLLKKINDSASIYQDGRRVFLMTPNHVYSKLDFGTELNLDSDYTYLTFWNHFSTKFKLADSDLVQDGEKNKFILSEKSKFLVDSYNVYLKRLAQVSWDQYDLPIERRPKALSMKDFIKAPPFVILRDNLGQRQVFKKSLFTLPQMAEPLIYLYSDKPMSVHIKFGSEIQLTRTNPPYPGHWDLELIPPNHIFEMTSQKRYKSLFWEGRTYLTPEWKEGWIVSRGQLDNFFNTALLNYGLNQLEINQFKRYWVPRMQNSHFYKIRFFTNRFLEMYAPISIDPKPDTLIRVHMDFQSAEGSEVMKEPQTPTRKVRQGFTFVEWSGMNYQNQD